MSINKVHSILVLTATLFTCSCAIQYSDDAGNQRIVGFSSITLSSEQTCNNPRFVSVETYGLGAVKLPSHGSVTVGYSQNSVLILDDNQSVTLDSRQIKTGKENE